MLPHKQTTERLEDGFFGLCSNKAKSSPWAATRITQTRTVSRHGSKGPPKRDNHIGPDHRRLDSLDDKRGRHQLSRPESKHQTRRPGILRDILRPRSAVRLPGNRRLQNTRTRVDEGLVCGMESSAPVSKREKTEDTCRHLLR